MGCSAVECPAVSSPSNHQSHLGPTATLTARCLFASALRPQAGPLRMLKWWCPPTLCSHPMLCSCPHAMPALTLHPQPHTVPALTLYQQGFLYLGLNAVGRPANTSGAWATMSSYFLPRLCLQSTSPATLKGCVTEPSCADESPTQQAG